jgi:hypothetical protein
MAITSASHSHSRAVPARRRRSSPLLRRPPHAGPGAELDHYDKADDGVALALPELSMCAAAGLALFFDDLPMLAQARSWITTTRPMTAPRGFGMPAQPKWLPYLRVGFPCCALICLVKLSQNILQQSFSLNR